LNAGKIIPWQDGETIVRFLPDGRIYVEKINENIHYPPKRITIKDLETVWGESYIYHKPYLEERPGILPKGTVEFLTISQDEKIGYVIVICREKCIRLFRIWNGSGEISEINIGYPQLIFKFIVFSGMVTSLACIVPN